MKTLLFCTSYAERQAAWNERWGRWLKAIAHSGLEADKILIVDDGSPLLPDWPGVAVFPADPSIADDSRVAIHHFADCRGQRVNGEPFPGWYRSFAYAVLYGMDRGFDKIIHIEADAFLITDHIVNYFNSVDCGWIALWCRRHNWPESTFQIINSDQFEACRKFFSQPYSAHLGPPYRAPEQLIPFTLINKSFIGDRYGESEDTVPFDADYVSQVKWGRGPEYYWWLHEDGTRRMPDRALLAAGRPDTETGKAAKPRIVALTMAKNEQDIIEPFVR